MEQLSQLASAAEPRPLRRSPGETPRPTWCWSSCAPASSSPASTCSSSTSRCRDIARDFGAGQPGRPVVGAERLRDRVRVAAGALRPPGRPLPARARLPARRGDLHRGVGGLRRRRPACRCWSRSAWSRRPARPCSPRPRWAWSSPPTRPSAAHGAVRTWTAIGGLAAALGPVVGGLLVAASWRWVFLVNVPIGLAALVVGWRRLPARARAPGAAARRAGRGAGHRRRRRAHASGWCKGSAWGWGSPGTVGALAAAVVLLALFAVHCARASNPLIEPGAVPGAHVLRRLAGA